MTTIATDGVTIAADGLRTWGGQIISRRTRKITVADKRVYAFCGTFPLFGPAVKWHCDGADVASVPRGDGEDGNENWWLLVIDRDGLKRYTSAVPWPDPFSTPFAMGAGGDVALGAMLRGASPEEAVRLVAEHLTHTGGEIQVIDIAEALGLAKPRAVAAE